MCGIIAVLRRPSERPAPSADQVLEPIDRALGLLGGIVGDPDSSALAAAAEALETAARRLGGVPGVAALDRDASLVSSLGSLLSDVSAQLVRIEAGLDDAGGDVESANVALVRLRDAAWSLRNDRLGSHFGVVALASSSLPPSEAGRAVLLSIQQALTAIDRMEVRGRDSAGLQVTVWDHDLDSVDAAAGRLDDRLYRRGSVRRLQGGGLAFVVKVRPRSGSWVTTRPHSGGPWTVTDSWPGV